MMHDVPYLVLSFLLGLLMSLFFFGGLWLTLKRMPESRSPGLLVFLSFIGRTAVVLLVIYLLLRYHWDRLLVFVAGFLVMRTIMVRRINKPSEGTEREIARNGNNT